MIPLICRRSGHGLRFSKFRQRATSFLPPGGLVILWYPSRILLTKQQTGNTTFPNLRPLKGEPQFNERIDLGNSLVEIAQGRLVVDWTMVFLALVFLAPIWGPKHLIACSDVLWILDPCWGDNISSYGKFICCRWCYFNQVRFLWPRASSSHCETSETFTCSHEPSLLV